MQAISIAMRKLIDYTLRGSGTTAW